MGVGVGAGVCVVVCARGVIADGDDGLPGASALPLPNAFSFEVFVFAFGSPTGISDALNEDSASRGKPSSTRIGGSPSITLAAPEARAPDNSDDVSDAGAAFNGRRRLGSRLSTRSRACRSSLALARSSAITEVSRSRPAPVDGDTVSSSVSAAKDSRTYGFVVGVMPDSPSSASMSAWPDKPVTTDSIASDHARRRAQPVSELWSHSFADIDSSPTRRAARVSS